MRGYQFRANNGRIELILGTTSTNRIFVQANSPLSADTWHRVGFSYDGSNNANGVNLFVDSAIAPSSIIDNDLNGTILNTAQLTAGVGTGAPGRFRGYIDEGSIWKKELSLSEYLETGSLGKPANLNLHSAYIDLVSWWRFGDAAEWDGSNWTLPDQKGNNDGVSVNMEFEDRTTNVP